MTPERHIRANEIKATISACQKELEKWQSNDACVSVWLTQNDEKYIREYLIESLEDRIVYLQEEYDKL